MERLAQKLTLDEAVKLALKQVSEEDVFAIHIFTKTYEKVWIENRIDGFRVYTSKSNVSNKYIK